MCSQSDRHIKKITRNLFDAEAIDECLSDSNIQISKDNFVVNIVAIRNHNEFSRFFVDKVCIVVRTNTTEMYHEFDASTKASLDRLISTNKIPFHCIIESGYYENFFRFSFNMSNEIYQAYPIMLVQKQDKGKISLSGFESSGYYNIKGVSICAKKYRNIARAKADLAKIYIKSQTDYEMIRSYISLQYKMTGIFSSSLYLLDYIGNKLVFSGKIVKEDDYRKWQKLST